MAHKINGISPPTVLNHLSFIIAYNLADKPSNFQAIDMIYPAEITANQDALVCLYSVSYEDNLYRFSYKSELQPSFRA